MPGMKTRPLAWMLDQPLEQPALLGRQLAVARAPTSPRKTTSYLRQLVEARRGTA